MVIGQDNISLRNISIIKLSTNNADNIQKRKVGLCMFNKILLFLIPQIKNQVSGPNHFILCGKERNNRNDIRVLILIYIMV